MPLVQCRKRSLPLDSVGRIRFCGLIRFSGRRLSLWRVGLALGLGFRRLIVRIRLVLWLRSRLLVCRLPLENRLVLVHQVARGFLADTQLPQVSLEIALSLYVIDGERAAALAFRLFDLFRLW